MGFLEDRDLTDVPSIPEYYHGKTIFMTGGSGFMGQVLIEKLLYSCPGLDRIYLLIRSKRGVNPEDRFKDLYSSSCFDRLRKEMPEVFKSKVTVMCGDVIDVGLGLSEEDRNLIVNTVNIIFHGAASTRFDDTLKYSMAMNVRGTREIIELAKDVKNLSAMVHLSTCYSNTKYEYVEEKMYPPLADWRDTLNVCDVIDEHSLNVLTSKYVDGLPNTYVFTKQLAEHVVYEQKGKLPIVIIRPSIIISSVKEPLPGWTNNLNGPMGFMAACGKGILRVLFTDPMHVCDYVPVDESIRSIIAVAWIRGTKTLEATDDVEIYHCNSNCSLFLRPKDLTDVGLAMVPVIPPEDIVWMPAMEFTTSITYFYLRTILTQVPLSLLLDSLLRLSGKNPLLMKLQRHMYSVSIALRNYMIRDWTFDNTNFILLRSHIKSQDLEQFYYEMEKIDVQDYLRSICYGIKMYVLKESIDNLPMAHYKRMKLLDQVVRIVFFGFIVWWILKTSFVQQLLSFN